MSTLPNSAPVPSTPVGPASRADSTALLPGDAFTRIDLAEIRNAGSIFALAIADISHHHIGDPGSWDLYASAPEELARLHAALDQMAEAIEDARDWLTAIEHRVRLSLASKGGDA